MKTERLCPNASNAGALDRTEEMLMVYAETKSRTDKTQKQRVGHRLLQQAEPAVSPRKRARSSVNLQVWKSAGVRY